MNPGITINRIAKLTGYSPTLIELSLIRLFNTKVVGRVGAKLYALEDYPDIVPDLTMLYKYIREHGETGLTMQQLIEMTKYPKHLVSHELKFLVAQEDIYYDTHRKRYFPIFKPVAATIPNLQNVALLSREELEALVKMFIQMITWGNNVLASQEERLISRRETITTTTPPPEPTKKQHPVVLDYEIPEGFQLEF